MDYYDYEDEEDERAYRAMQERIDRMHRADAARQQAAKERYAAKKADPNHGKDVVIKVCENCGSKQRSHINNRLIKCKNCIDSL